MSSGSQYLYRAFAAFSRCPTLCRVKTQVFNLSLSRTKSLEGKSMPLARRTLNRLLSFLSLSRCMGRNTEREKERMGNGHVDCVRHVFVSCKSPTFTV